MDEAELCDLGKFIPAELKMHSTDIKSVRRTLFNEFDAPIFA